MTEQMAEDTSLADRQIDNMVQIDWDFHGSRQQPVITTSSYSTNEPLNLQTCLYAAYTQNYTRSRNRGHNFDARFRCQSFMPMHDF